MATPKKTEQDNLKVPRKLKTPTYQRWRYSKRIKHPGPKLPSGWRIMRRSVAVIGQRKRLFAGVLFVYVVLSLVFVKGFAQSSQLVDTKIQLQAANQQSFDTGITLLTNLMASGSGASSQTAGAYQTVLIVIMSLVVIWVLRRTYGVDRTKKIKLKTAFYNSTTPLIQFLLLLGLFSLQLLPLMVGASVFNAVSSNGLAVTIFEKLAWGGAFLILATWSFFMITVTSLALYIVTLPDVQPMQALRSAKQLVRFRRWTVMRKILFLPIFLFFLTCLVMLPFVIWLTIIAEWVFFVYGLSVVIIVHAYMYQLYRELL